MNENKLKREFPDKKLFLVMAGLMGILFILRSVLLPEGILQASPVSILFRIAIGIIPVILCVIAYVRQHSRIAPVMAAGMLLCVVGDVIINTVFIASMAAFMLGHGCFIWAFMKIRKLHKIQWLIYVIILIPVLIGVILFSLGNAKIESFIPAVCVYAAVLILMAVSASGTYRWLRIGGIMFVISDITLGLRIASGIREGWIPVAVQLIYYAALLCMSAGCWENVPSESSF